MTSVVAREHQTAPMTSQTRLYWKVSGPVLLAVAALGFLLNAIGLGGLLGGFLSFDWTHNAVHLLLAGLAFAMASGGVALGSSKTVAKLVGGVYLALGVVGFISAEIFGLGTLLGLHLELGENLIHVALGGWALWASMSE